jgi:hypothetical protein
MEIPHEATLLRIFIGESDRHEWPSLILFSLGGMTWRYVTRP